MSNVTETTLTTSSFIAALNQFDELTYQEIINRINTIRETRKSETNRQIANLEAQLKQLKASNPGKKAFKEFVNPNNPNEVYRTGEYKTWMRDLAKQQGIDPFDMKAMKKWVKENSH